MLNITVCIYDIGASYTPLALALVDKVKKVYYFSTWEKDGFPLRKDDMVGTGIKGVERLSFPFSKLDVIDLWIFPDVYGWDIQVLLKRLGQLVWGASQSSWMELDRFALREWEMANKMPVAETEEYIGLDDLMKNMPKEKFIKISNYRGDIETFKFYDKQRSEYRAKELELHLGVLSKEMPMIGESKIEGYEIGADTYTVKGEFPKTMLWGIEMKDTAYLGKISDDMNLPKQLKWTNAKLEVQLKKEQTNSFISYEIRTQSPTNGYLTDMTMRLPNPPYQAHLAMIDNIAEVMYYGAQGIMVQPKFNSKYCAILIIKSDFAEDNIMPIKVSKEVRPYTYIMGLAVRDNEWYSLTNKCWGGEFGAIVGTGNTQEEAIKNCKKHVEGIQGDSLEIDVDALDKASQELRDMRKIGVMF